MTKEELIDVFADNLYVNMYSKSQIIELTTLLVDRINSKALDKIPNVIDNEVEEKKCVKGYIIPFTDCLDCDLVNKCDDRKEY